MQNTEIIDLKSLQSGDRETFARMVDIYSPNIYRLALRMMGDPAEAEDILQETFMNAFRSLPKFEGRSSLGTWLYRIASNQALMRLRKNTPLQISVDEPITSRDGGEIPRQLIDWCCLPEKEFVKSETMQELETALQTLSSGLRSAFILRDIHSLSTRETAELLNISEAAVKTRLLRARLKLREELSSIFNDRVQEHDYA